MPNRPLPKHAQGHVEPDKSVPQFVRDVMCGHPLERFQVNEKTREAWRLCLTCETPDMAHYIDMWAKRAVPIR